MAPSNKLDREAREARGRVRAYQARQAVHQHQSQRRRRDNIVAGAVLVLVLAALIGAQIAYFSGGPGTPSASDTGTPAPSTPPAGTVTATPGANAGDVPSSDLAEGRTWTGTLTLNDVPLQIELDGALAPQAVSSTISLAQSGFYDGLGCHRLTNGGFSVLQCGDPNGDGTGGPNYFYGPVENAPADDLYPAGTLAMARSTDAYSQGSQFFIVYADTTIPASAAGGYTVLGKVTSGLDQLITDIVDPGIEDGSSDGAPTVPTTITGITVQ